MHITKKWPKFERWIKLLLSYAFEPQIPTFVLFWSGQLHSGLERMGTATFDFVGDFDRDFDTFVPKYGNKYQLEGRNPDLDEKNIDFIHQLLL